MIDMICSRRSVRRYAADPVSDEAVLAMLECARFAPSGLNNQPWRFIVIDNIKNKETGQRLSSLTHYSDIIMSAPLLIAVFLDTAASYHREKDLTAIGACIQNILLAAHSMGLGAVWLGEILKNKDEVSRILKAPSALELVAVVAAGRPESDVPENAGKKTLNELVFKNEYLK